MIEELGPVGGVVGGPEDVHHHEVLDVEVLSALFQLVDVAPANALHLADHGQMDVGLVGVVAGGHDDARSIWRGDLRVRRKNSGVSARFVLVVNLCLLLRGIKFIYFIKMCREVA